MIIHFICTGNTYRSRIAEAYCASKQIQGLRIVSSGISAALNRGVLIQPYAEQILREHRLESFAAPGWQQTEASLVSASDVLVFMQREHYEFCKRWIEPGRQITDIWDVADVGSVSTGIMNDARKTFAIIRHHADELLSRLKIPRSVF